MADPWRPTLRKRAMLFALDVAARINGTTRRPRDGGSSVQAEVREILVIELWNIGDLVLTLPFLISLRSKFPAAKITLLGRGYAREVLGESGLVDHFIVADLSWSHRDRRRFFSRGLRELKTVIRELRRHSFDIAFKSRAHVREHFLLFIARARRKVAYNLGTGDSWITDPVAANLAETHKVDDWLGLLAPFGGPVALPLPRLRVSPVNAAWAERFLRDHAVSSASTVIGVHPGASVPEKRWPLGRFASIAEKLASDTSRTVITFASEDGYGAELGEIPRVVAASGLTIGQLIALIVRCDLLVCNDSGPMHLAAATHVPVVAIFGAGIARWFSPFGNSQTILAPPPGSPIDSISEADVVAAVEAALRSTREAPR